MNQTLQQWKDRFDAVSLRERAMIIAGVLVVIYTVWDFSLMQKIHNKHKLQASQVSQWQTQLGDIDVKIKAVTERLMDGGRSVVMHRIDSLKKEIGSINQIKKDITVGFIRPEQMAQVLRGLLKKEPGLRLVSLQSLEVEPLFTEKKPKKAEGRKAASQKKAPEEQKALRQYPDVFKHGVVIEFQGDYASTVNYLQNLERLPWKFYWEGVGYEVQQHPKALVTINVFTLSLDKDWIGV